MKIRFLMTGLLGLISLAAMAQKGELSNAQAEFDKYETMRDNKAMSKLAFGGLAAAKVSIDKAAANDKTATLPLTYALKGSIYAALAVNDTVPATSTPLFATAEEALKKAKELDTKGENKKMLDNADRSLAQFQLNKGIKEYGEKKYDLAYKSFDYFRQIMPEDTNAIYYTGLSAALNKDFDNALVNYNKLLTTKYSNKLRLYQDMEGFYLAKKDTAGAIKILNEGTAKYPNEAALSKALIELNLQTGKQQEVLNKIEGAIANDPKNKTLYYYAGITYTRVADDASKKITALNKADASAASKSTSAKPGAKPAPAATSANATQIAALSKTRDENLAKAADVYKKALAIDPNYFEVNLQLGYVLMSPAIDTYNAANKLPVTKQKEYQAMLDKSSALFDVAKPYLQKAVDLKPNDIDALNNLKTYYLGKKDMTHANELKKKVDALQSGAPAATGK